MVAVAALRAALTLRKAAPLRCMTSGGFWALGYERGLPGYDTLMADFGAGKVSREESPPAPAP